MKNEEKIKRYQPPVTVGLSDREVEERKQLGLVNKTNIVVGKTYFEIIFTDVFSFFNVLLFIIAGLMIAAKYYSGLFFLAVLIPNIGISLYQDIKARRLMGKLRILSQKQVCVIRSGNKVTIDPQDIVLDDVVCLDSDDQIPVDGIVLDETIVVDESALTGESRQIIKNKGDKLLSGSFVISGHCHMYAEVIGEESYIETIQAKAKKFKRSKSEILKSLTYMFRVIGIIVITLGVFIGVIYGLRGGFKDYESFQFSMRGISGSMIAMIPSGLYLLSTLALATGVLKLSKKGARVQDFYSIEMLARSNVICVDKTGTITSGEMDVKKVVLFGSDYTNEDVQQIVSNLLKATKDSNFTAKSLSKYFKYELTKGVVESLPFNSDNKYSAASFTGGDTFVLGASAFINVPNQSVIVHRTEEYTSQGYRVLMLGKSKGGIKDGKVVGVVEPIAFIILEDHIKDNAAKTFAWFKENGMQVKVISGDDPITVSRIAMNVEIENADKYISLENLSDEEVTKAALEYNVFGRATPSQKEIIVQTLKKAGNKVAMTGDGVNDMLALKRADCSIAMNSGSEAAKNVSHIVLMDSDFGSVPSIVAEGRRVVNNLQRTGSLFLVKTIFAMTTTLVFLITMITNDFAYPFHATYFMPWSLINIGIASFFLALERNNEPLKGSFLKTVFGKAVPASISILIPTFLIFVFVILQEEKILYTGTYSFQAATAMSVILFTVLGLVVLFKISLPMNKYRLIVFISSVVLEIGMLVGAGLISYYVGVEESILAIDYPSLTLVNYFVILILTVLTSTIYLSTSYIVEVLKGEHNVKD